MVIEAIQHHNKERIDKIDYWIYCCQIELNGRKKLCEIRYEVSACKWTLYKI